MLTILEYLKQKASMYNFKLMLAKRIIPNNDIEKLIHGFLYYSLQDIKVFIENLSDEKKKIFSKFYHKEIVKYNIYKHIFYLYEITDKWWVLIKFQDESAYYQSYYNWKLNSVEKISINTEKNTTHFLFYNYNVIYEIIIANHKIHRIVKDFLKDQFDVCIDRNIYEFNSSGLINYFVTENYLDNYCFKQEYFFDKNNKVKSVKKHGLFDDYYNNMIRSYPIGSDSKKYTEILPKSILTYLHKYFKF